MPFTINPLHPVTSLALHSSYKVQLATEKNQVKTLNQSIMKHLSIAVILFLAALGSTYATPRSGKDEPRFIGVENFKRQFPEATNINYKVKGQFTEVNFMWNGLQLEAFYDLEGNPLATTRDISHDNLPLTAQISLQKGYPNGVITNIIEYTDTNDGLSYYVTMASPKMTCLLHVSTSGDISVFKKMKH
jgi:hypothetical protein